MTIHARRLDATDERPESISIDVIDRGIGIAAENLAVIFEEFRQVDGTLNRQYGGTGLGLSLVRKFVELQGGTLTVASEIGKGSTFTFTLPIHFAGTTIPSPIINVDGTVIPPGERVLVVEDEDLAYSTLATYLQAAAYVPIRARNADEALRLARTHQAGGHHARHRAAGRAGMGRAARAESRRGRRPSLPVIIVSMIDNRELGLAFGADDYFVKPVDWTRLMRRLREITVRTAAPKRPRLLLIDDDVSVHDMLEAELTKQGYQIEKAFSGAEGLERAEASAPDVIILDLAMPGMSGFEVAALLKQSEATSRIPILAFTAKELTAADREQLRSGFSARRGEGRVGRQAADPRHPRARRAAGVTSAIRRSLSEYGCSQLRIAGERAARRRRRAARSASPTGICVGLSLCDLNFTIDDIEKAKSGHVTARGISCARLLEVGRDRIGHSGDRTGVTETYAVELPLSTACTVKPVGIVIPRSLRTADGSLSRRCFRLEPLPRIETSFANASRAEFGVTLLAASDAASCAASPERPAGIAGMTKFTGAAVFQGAAADVPDGTLMPWLCSAASGDVQ